MAWLGAERSDFFEGIALGLTDGLLVVDEAGVILWASPVAAEIFDRPVDELLGMSTIDLQHPEDAALSRARRLEAAAVGQVHPTHAWHSLRRIIRPDGTVRWCDCTGVDLTDDPRIGAVLLTLRDAGERHKAWETERRLRAIVETGQDVVLVYGRDGRLSYASPSAEAVLPISGGTLLELVRAVVRPDRVAEALAAVDATITMPGATLERELPYSLDGEGTRWLLVRASNLLDDPAVAGIVVNARDITSRVELEEHLRSSERRLAALVEHADDAIVVYDRDLQVSYQSPGALRLFGPLRGSIGEVAADLVHEEDHALTAQAIQTLQEQPGVTIDLMLRVAYLHGAGWLHLRATSLLDDPDVAGIVINGRDVTAQVEVEDRLREAARLDPLTGLPNRTRIVEHLTAALEAAEDPSRVVVLFLDLDRFKVVNDSFGHATGDRVLAELADRLRAAVGTRGTVGRFGGDEYVVVATDATREEAIDLADLLAATATAPFEVVGAEQEQAEVFLSGSVGIAVGTPGDSPANLLHHADAAMYRAKEHGRGTWELYDDGMRQAALARLTLEADLARALDEGGFELWYQPIVDVGGGQVRGLEALARWRRRDGRLVSPAEFIPVAEETGGIHRLGAWALATACAQGQAWHDQGIGPIGISVNLSPRQLTRDELANDIAAVLDATGFDPHLLTLEITESLLLADLELAVKALSRLRDVGVRLALDDFGTGWSSLTHLREVPVDIVKVDRSFIQGIDASPDDRAIVAAVVAMCGALGKEVVAEGVETEAQLRALRGFRCPLAQGYLFAKPLPAAVVPDWMERYVRNGNRDPDARA